MSVGLEFKAYDLIFEVHGEARNNMLAWMLGKFSVGMGLRGGGFFLSKCVNWNKEYDVHICDIQTRLLNAVVDATVKTIPPNLVITRPALTRVDELLKKNSIGNKDFVMIQMSVGENNREWPIENWKIIVSTLNGMGFKIVCADLDQEKVKFVTCAEHGSFYSFKVNLEDYSELVNRATAVISVETFCGHIASCFNTPTVSIYSGVTFWNEWRPRHNLVEHLQDTSCQHYPCALRICPFGHYSPCMKAISPSMVISAFNALMRKYQAT